MLKLVALLSLAACSLPATAAERVRNGHFTSGNTHFTNDMKFVAPNGKVPAADNTFTIGSLPNVQARPWSQPGGMGSYIIASGSATPRAHVWRQTGIPVVAGRQYIFDGMFAALHNDHRPVLEVYANYNDGRGGRFLGVWRAQNSIGVWQGMEARFVPTTNTMTISIKNLTGATAGNNFALDVIRVLTQCEWLATQPGGKPCTTP